MLRQSDYSASHRSNKIVRTELRGNPQPLLLQPRLRSLRETSRTAGCRSSNPETQCSKPYTASAPETVRHPTPHIPASQIPSPRSRTSYPFHYKDYSHTPNTTSQQESPPSGPASPPPSSGNQPTPPPASAFTPPSPSARANTPAKTPSRLPGRSPAPEWRAAWPAWWATRRRWSWCGCAPTARSQPPRGSGIRMRLWGCGAWGGMRGWVRLRGGYPPMSRGVS